MTPERLHEWHGAVMRSPVLPCSRQPRRVVPLEMKPEPLQEGQRKVISGMTERATDSARWTAARIVAGRGKSDGLIGIVCEAFGDVFGVA